MNNAQMSARVGLFFLLGVVLLWITYEALNGRWFSSEETYSVSTSFNTSKGLKAGDDVRMAGVKIGSVKATRLSGGRAEVMLNINRTVPINRDATATVAMANMFGGNYVSLDYGTPASGQLAAGATLRSQETGDMNQVLNDLGTLTTELKSTLSNIGQSLGGGTGGGVFQKLDKLFSDNSENLSRTIENLQATTSDIRSGRGTLGKLINDPAGHEQLLASIAELKKATAEANAFLADARTIIADVKSGKGAVGTLLYDEPTAASLRTTVKNLRELSVKLNNSEGTLGKLLADDSLFKDVQGVIRKADRALGGIEDQGPITAVGIAANALF